MTAKSNKFFRIVSYVTLAICVTLYISHLVWKSSGNSEWKVVRDENNLTVYTMKVPGETLLKYKFNMTVDARLSDFVYYMTLANHGDVKGAIDLYRIDQAESNPLVIFYDTYKVNLDPFGMREVVLMGQYMQNPETGVVNLDIVASPNKIPPTDGLKRITHLSNHWKITPIEPGKIAVETTSDIDLGVPYFISNMVVADVMFETTEHIRKLLKTETFQNRSAQYIKEPFDA